MVIDLTNMKDAADTLRNLHSWYCPCQDETETSGTLLRIIFVDLIQ